MLIVYILLSEKDPKKYYVGLTENLERRLAEHNSAGSGYSRRYAPWRIETYTKFSNDEQAIAFEKYLKSGSGFAFLKKRLI